MLVEVTKGTEHGGIQETEQGIQLRQVVLHRRAAQGQAMTGFQQEYGLGDLCTHILDGLAFVQDDITKLLLAEGFDIVAHHGVCGEDDLVGKGFLQVTCMSIISVYGQLRSKLAQLVLPIEEEAAGHDHQAGHGLLRIKQSQHGDGLQSLSQAHIIGQTTSKIIVIQVFDPLYTLFLVGAQGGIQSGQTQFLFIQAVESFVHRTMMLEHLSGELIVQHLFYFREVEEGDFHLFLILFQLEKPL